MATRSDTRNEPIVLVSALREELAPLLQRARVEQRQRVDARPLVQGRIGDVPVALTWSGEGEENARETMNMIYRLAPRSPLIAVGVAGALTPELPVGALVLAERIIDAERTLACEGRLYDAGLAVDGVRSGTLVSVDRVVDSPSEKTALWRQYGCPSIAAVDMESSTFAAAAVERNLPFIVARVIADKASDTLPVFLNGCRRPDGSIDRWRVAWNALTRPGSIPTLWTMRKRLITGAAGLAEFTLAVLADERWRTEACVG